MLTVKMGKKGLEEDECVCSALVLGCISFPHTQMFASP
jgi:hypothetical protein